VKIVGYIGAIRKYVAMSTPTPPVPFTADDAAVNAIASAEYTHIMNEGARKNAMQTATNRPTVKIINA
jgi:hypothetical protein